MSPHASFTAQRRRCSPGVLGAATSRRRRSRTRVLLERVDKTSARAPERPYAAAVATRARMRLPLVVADERHLCAMHVRRERHDRERTRTAHVAAVQT